MISGTDKCSICEENFYVNKMVEGKCDACNVRFPGVKNLAELIASKKKKLPEYNKGNFDNRVKEIVTEMLKEYGALVDCECGNVFYKKSGSHKSCGNCKETK